MIKNQSLSQSILELTTTADQLKSMSKTSDSERARIKATNVELTAEIEREKGATEKAKKEKEKLLAELEDSKGKEASFKSVTFHFASTIDADDGVQEKGNSSGVEIGRSASFDPKNGSRSFCARGIVPFDVGGSSFEDWCFGERVSTWYLISHPVD